MTISTIKKSALALSLVVFCSSALKAEENSLPKASDLIQAYADMLYGDFDLNNYSLTLKGNILFEQYNMDGPVVFKYKGPDKFSVEINIFGSEISRRCNAGQCWSKKMNPNFSELKGISLAFRLEASDFGRFQHMNKYYKSLKTILEIDVDGEPAYKVEGLSKNDYTNYFYFSKNTGRLVSTESYIPRPERSTENTTYFSDFHQHGDLLLAMEQFETNPQANTVIQIEEVSFQEIPDSEFEPPVEIRNLLK